MARAIELIEKDIAALKEAIAAIATELHNAYSNYLNTLGEVLRKQLTLATYHLCTQSCPDRFLKLSLNQRQKLQQAIRKLGKNLAELLKSYLQEPSNNHPTEETPELEDILTYLLSQSPTTLINGKINNFTPDPTNPVELVQWHQNLEALIQHSLKKVSQEANLVLQKAGILPKKLPEPVLEAAGELSEASTEVVTSAPNLLNLVVEIENQQNEDEPTIAQIMAIHLRLPEIEFASTKLSAHRREIHNVLVKLKKVGREYQKRQRERSIVEAEAAWRASWFED